MTQYFRNLKNLSDLHTGRISSLNFIREDHQLEDEYLYWLLIFDRKNNNTSARIFLGLKGVAELGIRPADDDYELVEEFADFEADYIRGRFSQVVCNFESANLKVG